MTKKFFSVFIILNALAIIPGFPEKKDTGLLHENLVQTLIQEISGERTLDYVRELARFDRITATREYDQAAQYVLQKLRTNGILNSAIQSFPLEWQSEFYMENQPNWWPYPGWDVKKATLSVVHPELKIADYREEPITLARMSRSFRGRGELVYVGKGTSMEDYNGLDVRGKIVLAEGLASAVHPIAILEKEAIGIICFGTGSYGALKGTGHPDMVVWQVLSPVENELKRPQYAFSISQRIGRRLLSLLASREKVEVEVDVKTEFYPNTIKIVQASIPGTDLPDEEFLFYAHLDHVLPSAGDNASGCALLVEIASTLTKLINKGQIPSPRRSIRFVWGPEGPGSFMYINAYIQRLNQTLAGLNLDMVGLDMDKTRAIFRITQPPNSLPSYLTDLVQNLIENLDTRYIKAPTGKRSFLNYRFVPFTASSDHYFFNDGSVKVPMMMFNYSPDEFHHTNLDTADTLDASELKKVGYLTTATALFIAYADNKDAYDLAQITALNGWSRIFRSINKGLMLMRESAPDDLVSHYRAGIHYILSAAERETEAIRSVTQLCAGLEEKHLIRSLALKTEANKGLALKQLETIYLKNCSNHRIKPDSPQLSEEERSANRIIPRRTGRYLNASWQSELNMKDLDETDQAFLEEFKNKLVDSYIRIPEILNFIDGKRDLLAIRDLVSAEYFGFQTASDYSGHAEDIGRGYRGLEITDLMRFLKILKKAGMVDY